MDLTSIGPLDTDPTFKHFANTVAALSSLHDLIAEIPPGSGLRYRLEEKFCDVHNEFVRFSTEVM
jgi:hypothetical protein